MANETLRRTHGAKTCLMSPVIAALIALVILLRFVAIPGAPPMTELGCSGQC